MMSEPERGPERDAALDALLATIPFAGWSLSALRQAAGPNADLLFPGGAVDMVEAHSDLADRRMAEGAPTDGKVSARVRAILLRRLAQSAAHKQAVQRGLGVLAAHPATGAACVARTVDAIWHEAGDRSADFSWYTKRAILTGIYSSTLLFWLRDDSLGDTATAAFLDRRLAGIGRIGKLRRRGEAMLQRLQPTPAT